MKTANIVCSIIFILLASAVLRHTYTTFPAGVGGVPGPGSFPIITSLVIIFLGCIMLGTTLFKKGEHEKISWLSTNSKRVYIIIAAIYLNIFLISIIGFFVVTIIFLSAVIKWFSKKTYIYSFIFAGLITVSMYIVFSMILRVPLQFGLLF